MQAFGRAVGPARDNRFSNLALVPLPGRAQGLAAATGPLAQGVAGPGRTGGLFHLSIRRGGEAGDSDHRRDSGGSSIVGAAAGLRVCDDNLFIIFEIIPQKSLTSGKPVAIWDGRKDAASGGRFRPRRHRSKTPEKRTGEVRPAPRARNQAREPRRRRRAPAPARDTRETGSAARRSRRRRERNEDGGPMSICRPLAAGPGSPAFARAGKAGAMKLGRPRAILAGRAAQGRRRGGP